MDTPILKNPWSDDYDNTVAFHTILSALKEYGFHDATWHNNTCPSIAWYPEGCDEGIDIWVDYQDKSKSESGYRGNRCILIDAYYCHDGKCDQQVGFLPSQLMDIVAFAVQLQATIKAGLGEGKGS